MNELTLSNEADYSDLTPFYDDTFEWLQKNLKLTLNL